MTLLVKVSPSSQRNLTLTVLVCWGVQHLPSTHEPQYLGRYFFTLEHPAYVNFTGEGDFLVLVHFFPFCKGKAITLLAGDSFPAFTPYLKQLREKNNTRRICIYL